MRAISIALGVAIVAGWLCTPGQAAVLRVPSEYATINLALDASVPGDSVLVAPGVYDQYETRMLEDGGWYSSVGFLRGGVALVSEAGASSTTLRMDSTQMWAVVLRAFGQTGSTLVSGFTITGTVELTAIDYGFGDRIVVRDCIIRDIASGTHTGGVGSVSADMEVYGCRFENIIGGSGSALGQTSGTLIVEDCEFIACQSGAAFFRRESFFSHATSLVMRRCRFISNLKTTGGGGAVATSGYSSVLIEDCWFEGNRTQGPSSSGGALATGGPWCVVRNNTFVGNSAERGNGGALYISGPGAVAEGNTFWGNWMEIDQPNGGAAVYLPSGTGTLDLRNNVIAGSLGAAAAGRFPGRPITTSCNIFWANESGDAAFPLDATDLVVDPLFCDVPAKDFRVSAASPCLPGQGHPSCSGLIGAWGEGCGTVPVDRQSWGQVKGAYRMESLVGR